MEDEMTTALYVGSVITRAACEKHDVGTSQPCFVITGKNEKTHRAVCNDRARAAGFRAPISPNSLRTFAKKKENKR
jgi:hypothetical protein